MKYFIEIYLFFYFDFSRRYSHYKQV